MPNPEPPIHPEERCTVFLFIFLATIFGWSILGSPHQRDGTEVLDEPKTSETIVFFLAISILLMYFLN